MKRLKNAKREYIFFIMFVGKIPMVLKFQIWPNIMIGIWNLKIVI